MQTRSEQKWCWTIARKRNEVREATKKKPKQENASSEFKALWSLTLRSLSSHNYDRSREHKSEKAALPGCQELERINVSRLPKAVGVDAEAKHGTAHNEEKEAKFRSFKDEKIHVQNVSFTIAWRIKSQFTSRIWKNQYFISQVALHLQRVWKKPIKKLLKARETKDQREQTNKELQLDHQHEHRHQQVQRKVTQRKRLWRFEISDHSIYEKKTKKTMKLRLYVPVSITIPEEVYAKGKSAETIEEGRGTCIVVTSLGNGFFLSLSKWTICSQALDLQCFFYIRENLLRPWDHQN